MDDVDDNDDDGDDDADRDDANGEIVRAVGEERCWVLRKKKD